jgi:hypothetical protein
VRPDGQNIGPAAAVRLPLDARVTLDDRHQRLTHGQQVCQLSSVKLAITNV